MNTVLVWVLVTLGGAGGDQVTYSPPMPDLATCEFLRKNALETSPSDQLQPRWFLRKETRPSAQLQARCIQIPMVVTR